LLTEDVIRRILSTLPGAPLGEVLDEFWGSVRDGFVEEIRRFLQVPGPEPLLRMEEILSRQMARLGSCLVASSIVLVHSKRSVVERAIALTKQQRDEPLRHVGTRETPVLFIGGLRLQLNTPYLAQDLRGRPGRRRAVGRRGPEGTGCYPVLAQLGVHDGATPAVASEVARQAVRNSSFETARQALAERGCALDVKQVRRLALEVGRSALEQRDIRVLAAEAGEVFSRDLAGKRVVVGVDGGRLRTRVGGNRGRRKPNGRRRYRTPWREPRLISLFTVDERGRLEKGSPMLDASLCDADQAFALLRAELKLRGASSAREIVIVSDGAEWIWNRTAELAKHLCIDPGHVTRILDFYHAAQHLGNVAEAVAGWSEKERRRWFRKQRRALRDGKTDQVLKAVAALRRGRRGKVIGQESAYLEKHREDMRYPFFRSRGIPCGSGTTESGIRRVINLRLKGTGIFWREANAEAMLHLRAYLKAGRWDELIHRVVNRTPDGRPNAALEVSERAEAA
jgi:hypothetical protein